MGPFQVRSVKPLQIRDNVYVGNRMKLVYASCGQNAEVLEVRARLSVEATCLPAAALTKVTLQQHFRARIEPVRCKNLVCRPANTSTCRA
jgi:hypothetical protein